MLQDFVYCHGKRLNPFHRHIPINNWAPDWLQSGEDLRHAAHCVQVHQLVNTQIDLHKTASCVQNSITFRATNEERPRSHWQYLILCQVTRHGKNAV